MSDPILVARGLTRRYRVGPSEIRALDGLDLDVARGEFLALLGPSGCGKSTLLHVVGGLVHAEGDVRDELARDGAPEQLAQLAALDLERVSARARLSRQGRVASRRPRPSRPRTW